jgi:hypothetical protein
MLISLKTDGFHETCEFLHDPLAAGRALRVLWCNRDMSLDHLCEVLEGHAGPNLAAAIDGVRICKTDHPVSPGSSMSGTVLAVIARVASASPTRASPQ